MMRHLVRKYEVGEEYTQEIQVEVTLLDTLVTLIGVSFNLFKCYNEIYS